MSAKDKRKSKGVSFSILIVHAAAIIYNKDNILNYF